MSGLLRGRAWVFGDQIDTDILAPGPYMRQPLRELSRHCLEAVNPRFARDVQAGDIVVGGRGFGIGSSREQAVQVLAELGVAGIVAQSFARIFYRNALNLGVPALQCESPVAEDGEEVELRPLEGLIINHSRSIEFRCEPIPAALLAIVEAGGLMAWLAARMPAT